MPTAINDPCALPPLWVETAAAAVRRLGMDWTLLELAPEHWRLVLVNVEAKMRMRGVVPPPNWKKELAQQVGRSCEADHKSPSWPGQFYLNTTLVSTYPRAMKR